MSPARCITGADGKKQLLFGAVKPRDGRRSWLPLIKSRPEFSEGFFLGIRDLSKSMCQVRDFWQEYY